MNRPLTNQEKVAARLRRGALPLAFLFGFIASWIALDPLGTGAVKEEQEIQRGLASASNKEHLESMASTESDPSHHPSESTEESISTSAIPAADTGPESDPAEYGALPGADGYPEQAAQGLIGRLAPNRKNPEGKNTPEKRVPASSDSVASVDELRFDTNVDLWNGKAQLLPNPMFLEQLASKRARDVRGGGWMVIDSAKGEIQRVELFKASSKTYTSRQAIEAKVVLSQGGRVLNTVNTGFPIVRGIPGIVQGSYEVSETPQCLVRYSIVMTDEVCNVPRPRGAGGSFRFRFEAPLVGPDSDDSEFKFTTVYIESPEGQWSEIGSFNESFTPIGDPNRDGVPDFYLESVTESNESGRHDLLISNLVGDVIQYTVYSARFLGR
ncbi:MAG: hypothetical protein U1E10_16600 [Bdellovibrionales bacterium]|nr:hypothetical protein [Bdellovibrionales bacterium]